MIFVTVGNHPQGFIRLLREIDRLAKDRLKSKVFVQTGYSDFIPDDCNYTKFLRYNDFQALMEKSNIIITHAGAGSILNALSNNKPIIAVPRLKKFCEHSNDHQLQLARALEKEGRIIAVYNIKDLESALENARAFKPKIAKTKSYIIELIENYLTEAGLISE